MPSLLFITPAWQRFELTRLCMWQRRQACDSLLEAGVDATCVVIADDENLEIAREYGFETVESPNDFLSRRFNDGYEFAGKNGFDYCAAIGSDSWIDPKLLEVLPNGQMQTTRNYGLLNKTGDRIAQIRLKTMYGFSLFVLPTKLLAPLKFRPGPENLAKGCDGALYKGLFGNRPPTFVLRELSPLDVVAFRSEIQITPYERLVTRHRAREYPNPFERLKSVYSEDVVKAAETFHFDRLHYDVSAMA